ncbi:MAG: hypothetical protein ACJA0J_002000, partial [Bdellovibrionota bacterium]
MKIRPLIFYTLAVLIITTSAVAVNPDWGFFGHRRINRLAVFTLDYEMMPFFRANIEWLTDHAVDPDKRRYATKHEAVRHYIDIDHWGESKNFAFIPRRWTDALLWKGELKIISAGKDTISWTVDTIIQADPDYLFDRESRVLLSSSAGGSQVEVQLNAYREFWIQDVLPTYYEEKTRLSPSTLRIIGFPINNEAEDVLVVDHLSSYGILPWHLEQMHRRITKAFKD